MGRIASGQTRTDRYFERQKNGSYYVYERQSVYDSKTGQYKSIGKTLLGKIPAGHPLTEEPVPTRPKIKAKQKSGQEISVTRTSTGMIDILNHIVDNSGVKNELDKVLDEDIGTRDKILTCAMYLLANDGESWAGMHTWTRDHLEFLPYIHGPITKDVAHDLVDYLGNHPEIKTKVFVERAKDLDDDELLALDSSTYYIETETGEIRFVQPSMHKDKSIKPVYNVVEIFAIKRRKPIAYTIIPGNIPDSKTVGAVLKKLDFLKLKTLEMVSDGGYCTEESVGLMLSKNQHFVTHIEADTKWISSIIEENRSDLLYGGEVVKKDSSFTGLRFPVKHTFHYNDEDTGKANEITKRVNVFIYHSSSKAAIDERDLLEKFSRYSEDLLDDAVVGENQKEFDSFCQKYMVITKNESGAIIKITRNNAEWKKKMRHNGFLVIIADKEKDINAAFEKYRARETIEEDIKNGKMHSGCDITRKHSEETIDGQFFVQFECKSLRESFHLELNSIKSNLAVPNGNDKHDKTLALKKESKLRRWLQQTSMVNIIKWFAQLKQTVVKDGKKEYVWKPDYIERDKMFLEKLGLYTDEK